MNCNQYEISRLEISKDIHVAKPQDQDFVLSTNLHFSSHGFLAFGHDHLGHGLSSGDRATVPNMELYVDDIVCHTLRYKAPWITFEFAARCKEMYGLLLVFSICLPSLV